MIVIGIDILTTCESCALVNDLSMTNRTYCTHISLTKAIAIQCLFTVQVIIRLINR